MAAGGGGRDVPRAVRCTRVHVCIRVISIKHARRDKWITTDDANRFCDPHKPFRTRKQSQTAARGGGKAGRREKPYGKTRGSATNMRSLPYRLRIEADTSAINRRILFSLPYKYKRKYIYIYIKHVCRCKRRVRERTPFSSADPRSREAGMFYGLLLFSAARRPIRRNRIRTTFRAVRDRLI